MNRSHLTHYTFIEAANAWQRPIMDVVQMAANKVFPAYVVIDEGWAELEPLALLKSLNTDFVQVERVKREGKWCALPEPVNTYWGTVFVDAASYQRFMADGAKAVPQRTPEQVYLTAKEVARRLNVQPDTLSKWRQAGKGPKFQNMGRTVRYCEADVQEYLKNLPKT